MPKFHYRVADCRGRQSNFSLEAPDRAASLRTLRKMGFTIIREIHEEETGFWKKRLRPRHRFDLKNFADRLHPLLVANIPLEKALGVLEDGYTRKEDLEVVQRLRRGLHEGKRFSVLLREMHTDFPPLFASLVEVGEESGCMAEVMGELRRFLKESRDFRNFVVTSSIYPVIVLTVTLLVIILLFTVFVPRFAKIFAELGREMPLLTRIMLQIGKGLQAVWWIWPLLIVGAIWMRKVFRKHPKIQRRRDEWQLKIPILQGIVIGLEMSRFLRTLAIMLKNHVRLLTATRVARKVFDNVAIADDFAGVEERLQRGDKLSNILSCSRFMPQGSIAMLKIAEEAGDFGEMLERIALETEDETRIKTKRLLAYLEPAIILLLAAVVLLVVLAIFLAIMELNIMK